MYNFVLWVGQQYNLIMLRLILRGFNHLSCGSQQLAASSHTTHHSLYWTNQDQQKEKVEVKHHLHRGAMKRPNLHGQGEIPWFVIVHYRGEEPLISQRHLPSFALPKYILYKIFCDCWFDLFTVDVYHPTHQPTFLMLDLAIVWLPCKINKCPLNLGMQVWKLRTNTSTVKMRSHVFQLTQLHTFYYKNSYPVSFKSNLHSQFVILHE